MTRGRSGSGAEVSEFRRDRGLGELWNTLMVGVFVAFISVVYGRVIYMSLP